MMEWYYAKSNQRMGPVSQDEIQELSDRGEIGPDTLVWHEGLDNWQPLSSMGEYIEFRQSPGRTVIEPAIGSMDPDVGGPFMVKRFMAWFIDFIIYITAAGTLSFFLFGQFHTDRSQFLKDYKELSRFSSPEKPQPESDGDTIKGQPGPKKNFWSLLKESREKTKEFNKKYPTLNYWTQGTLFGLWVLIDTLMVAYFGGTVGKLIMGLRVFGLDTNLAGFYSGLGKSIVRAMEATLLPFLLVTGFLLLFNREKRSVSDLLNGVMVRGRIRR